MVLVAVIEAVDPLTEPGAGEIGGIGVDNLSAREAMSTEKLQCIG